LAQGFSFDVRFYRLSAELQPYFTALYSYDIRCDDDAVIIDRLHPEWSSMRVFARGAAPQASIVPEPVKFTGTFPISGPTSRALSFCLSTAKIWGLGLLPLGWARFCRAPAHELADQIVDGTTHPAYEMFRPLPTLMGDGAEETDDVATAVNEFLLAQDLSPVPAQDQILACQQALSDPLVGDVETLAGRVGVGRRTLERLCRRYFGFSPKLLLRRQRFLRSLAAFMLGPKDNWSKALDGQYYDQAHFVRDFRRFMGMSPTEYAEMPHPVLDRIMAQRMVDHGVALRTDLPTLLRYSSPAIEVPRG